MKKINFLNSEKIVRLTPLATDSVEVANEIIAKNVKVFPKLKNVTVENLSDLWEMQFPSSPSTYCLYIYALYPVSYLLNAFEETGEERYLTYAKDLALNFISWESKKKNINAKKLKILYGDHSVSNRTQAMCYLACCLRSCGQEIPLTIVNALLDNGNYLADEDKYSHYNHGLMMDLALLGLLNTLNGLKISYPSALKCNLINRLQHSITRDITKDGVHIENSPGYHFWILSFLGKITAPLATLDQPLHDKAQDALCKVSEYAKYITRSDGSVPAIGDTHAGLKYKPTNGLTSKYYEDSNQVIFRSSEIDTWAHFSSGYKTHVHKHCDNGSFNLFHKGHDVFMDPGFLNYENTDDSQLIKSASFHNTAVPKGKEQFITSTELSVHNKRYSENLSHSRIVGFAKDAEMECALGIISDYSDVEIERLIVWLKPSVFVVFDTMTQSEDSFEQNFHISPTLRLSTNKDVVTLSSNVTGEEIAKVTQLTAQPSKESRLCFVDNSAFYSKSFGVKEGSQRLVFSASGEASLIAVELSTDYESAISIDRFDGEILSYSHRGNEKILDLLSLKAKLLVKKNT